MKALYFINTLTAFKKNKHSSVNYLVTALVSNVYLTAMANKAEQLFEETLQADILSHSR